MNIGCDIHVQQNLRDGTYWYDVTTRHKGETLTVACDTPRNVGKHLAKLLVSLGDRQIVEEAARAVETSNCAEDEDVVKAKEAIAAHTETCDMITRLQHVAQAEGWCGDMSGNRASLSRMQKYFTDKRAQAIVDLYDAERRVD